MYAKIYDTTDQQEIKAKKKTMYSMAMHYENIVLCVQWVLFMYPLNYKKIYVLFWWNYESIIRK